MRSLATPILMPILIMIAALGLAACSGSDHDQAAPDQVRVEVINVGFDSEAGAHFVLLEDAAGKRALPIVLGEDEARAIMFELHGVKPERPLTYELLGNVIEQTGNHVDRVVINDVHDKIYFAKIYLDSGRYAIDCRPSDAIALAMGVKAPIFVTGRLLVAETDQSAPGAAASIDTATGFGLTVQELTPQLAKSFDAEPGSGVLVADLGEPARKAGLKRADIIVEVRGHAVKTLADFRRETAAAHDANVTLTVRRQGITRTITLDTVAVAQGPAR